jgi:hypothetical protein
MIQGETMSVSRVKASSRRVQSGRSSEKVDGSGERKCFSCGSRHHTKPNCKFKEYSCGNCGKVGHVEELCFKTKTSDSDSSVNSDRSDRHRQSEKFVKVKSRVRAIRCPESGSERPILAVAVQGVELNMLMDTGADVTVLSIDDVKRLREVKVVESDRVIVNADECEVQNFGMFECEFELNSGKFRGKAYVTPFESVIGMDWLRKSEEFVASWNAMCGESGSSDVSQTRCRDVKLMGEGMVVSPSVRELSTEPKRKTFQKRSELCATSRNNVAVRSEPESVQSTEQAQVIKFKGQCLRSKVKKPGTVKK